MSYVDLIQSFFTLLNNQLMNICMVPFFTTWFLSSFWTLNKGINISIILQRNINSTTWGHHSIDYTHNVKEQKYFHISLLAYLFPTSRERTKSFLLRKWNEVDEVVVELIEFSNTKERSFNALLLSSFSIWSTGPSFTKGHNSVPHFLAAAIFK